MGIFFSAILGACVGSFLNVVSLRLPANQSLKGRSHCTNCKKQLKPLELIPIFSYLLLRAKCLGCQAKIHWRYMAGEFITCAIFALAWHKIQPENILEYTELIKIWLTTSMAIVVFIIDLDHYLILDKVIITSSMGLLLLNLFLDALSGNLFSWNSYTVSGLVSALVLSAVLGGLWQFSKGRWLGLGDVKFMLPFGLAATGPLGLLALGLSSIIGALTGLSLILMRKAKMNSRLPFGVFLSTGLIITILWGQEIWSAYTRMLWGA